MLQIARTRLTSCFERDQEDCALGVVVEVLDRVVPSDRSHRTGNADVFEATELQATGDDITEETRGIVRTGSCENNNGVSYSMVVN